MVVRQFVTRGICIKNNKVLILNKKGEPHFFLPGGRVEENEGYEEALIREIKEELDKDISIIRYLGAIEHSFTHYTGKPYYEVGNFFLINIDGMDIDCAFSNEDELEFQWKDIDELESINIKPKPVIELIKKSTSSNKEAFWASTLPKK
jgi:8-oxo-dGTP pyrophosphatase MutT (NUDIX family)